MKILFLIRSLNQGGAERQVVNLAVKLKQKGYSPCVIVYYNQVPLAKKLHEAEVPLICIGKKGRWDVFIFMFRLIMRLKKERPDILYSYLSTSNILAVLLKSCFPRMRVVWGIRSSNMDLKRYNWLWRVSFIFEKLLSRFADRIIVNSKRGMSYSIEKGFYHKYMLVIHNGIMTDDFIPNSRSRYKMRQSWDIRDDEILIGIVARMDPKKNLKSFLTAAAQVIDKYPRVKCICIGRGKENYYQQLRQYAIFLGIENRVIWAGPQINMPQIYNGLDVLCLSSLFGEGFPNVIGEAMSCGVPCVATDVGDAKLIIGNQGIVVPPNNPNLLAEGLLKMISRIEKHDNSFGQNIRQRIVVNFGINKMVTHTSDVFNSLSK